MKRAFWGSLLLVAAVLGVLVGGGHALAATSTPGFNIITSPLPIKLTTTPGKTVTAELRMKNQSDQPEDIKVGLMKFGATGENGVPDLFSLTSQDVYGSWVHFEPSTFVAQPGIWQTVKMTINVPSNASLGYYLAVTFSRAQGQYEKGATNLNGSVATLVLLNVQTANEQRALQILNFTADHKLYEYLPVTFNVRLHNSGNIYIPPAGNIFISRGSKQLATLDFNSAGGSVLPASNRVFHLNWDQGFPVFKPVQGPDHKPLTNHDGTPKENLSWDFGQLGKFRFGHYTAKLLVVYNNGRDDVPLQASLSFWVIPWKLLLVVLLLLVVIGYGLWSMLRSSLRKTRAGASRLKKLRRPKHDQK